MELAELFADITADVAAEILVEVLADVAAEVLAEVAGGEHISVIDTCWRYRRVLAWFST